MFGGTMLKKIAVIVFILAFTTSSLGSSYAAGLLASPGGFQISMKAPQTYQGSLTVENIGNESLKVTIVPKRIQQDNIRILFSDVGIAKWITVNPKNFTLAPSEKKSVKFTVNIPSNLNISDAVGALVITGYPPKNNLSGRNQNLANLQIQQIPQIAVKVAVGFPGPIIESLVLENETVPALLTNFMNSSFVYQVKNNGTVYANMTGNVQLNGWFNQKNLTMDGVVYPDDHYYLMTNWEPGFLDFGLYQVNTTINYGRFEKDKTIQSTGTVFVFPVWLIILIVAILVIWTIRKKEIEVPIKIKIEKKK